MGLQFENLVRNDLVPLLKLLKVAVEDVRYIQPFFQTATKKRKGCQVDLMIQTKFNTLYLCEIKFSQKEIGVDAVDEVKKKN